MKCIIKEKRIRGAEVTESERRIAFIEGGPCPCVHKSVRYENTETDEEYLCLSGGFAWPGLAPGFAVVIAARSGEKKEEPIFVVLAEVEQKDPMKLLQGAYELFARYGANCAEVPWVWYGDGMSGLNYPFTYKFNERMRKEDGKATLLVQPPHFEETDSFVIYCQTINSLMLPESKRLHLGEPSLLRNYLQLSKEEIYAGTAEKYPAVAALGYVISALHAYHPWLDNVPIPSTEPDPWDDSGRSYYRSTMPHDHVDPM